MSENKIKSFTDLIAWQKAHTFVLSIYKITVNFPKEEIYGLTSQIKRSALSISANIAEGFSRRTNKDKIQFYHVALGSLTEVQNYLVVAKDIKVINNESFQDLAQYTIEISKLVNGLIRSIK